jgi:pyridoxal phosphate enzyme (YggS family)
MLRGFQRDSGNEIFAVTGQITSIAANIGRVYERIAKAAGHAGRPAAEITLVGISKTFPAESIRDAYTAGLRHFGENRVQEWESKQSAVADLQATWHFVGHLQSNKSRRAVHLFGRVDSVDTAGLAQKLHAAASDEGKRLPILIEVCLGDEPTKSGVRESDLFSLAEAVLALSHLELLGLMTIPPYFDDPEQVRPYFRRLRELRDGLSQTLNSPLRVLSMGMSHDFEIAIEEGATEIRIGTGIFGGRSDQGR